jgi:hypothetical protein
MESRSAVQPALGVVKLVRFVRNLGPTDRQLDLFSGTRCVGSSQCAKSSDSVRATVRPFG